MKKNEIKKTLENMLLNDCEGMSNRLTFSSVGLALIWVVIMSIKKGSYWEYYRWAYTKEGLKKSFKAGFLITLVSVVFALVPAYIKERKAQQVENTESEYTVLE